MPPDTPQSKPPPQDPRAYTYQDAKEPPTPGPAFNSPESRRLGTEATSRAAGIQNLLERVAGGSLESIAEKYKTNKRTVGKLLTEEVKEEIIDELRTKVLVDLIPMAMAVFEARLKMGDLEAARYLVDNFGVAKRPQQSVKVQPALPSASDIESYRLDGNRASTGRLPG